MRKLSQTFDTYVLPLFMGTVFFVLGAHALNHQSHPGAALYLIGFILWGYLRRISEDVRNISYDHMIVANNSSDNLELLQEQRAENKMLADRQVARDEYIDKKDAAYSRDVVGMYYDSELERWVRAGQALHLREKENSSCVELNESEK